MYVLYYQILLNKINQIFDCNKFILITETNEPQNFDYVYIHFLFLLLYPNMMLDN